MKIRRASPTIDEFVISPADVHLVIEALERLKLDVPSHGYSFDRLRFE
jgi:hypothetical protein